MKQPFAVETVVDMQEKTCSHSDMSVVADKRKGRTHIQSALTSDHTDHTDLHVLAPKTFLLKHF